MSGTWNGKVTQQEISLAVVYPSEQEKSEQEKTKQNMVDYRIVLV